MYIDLNKLKNTNFCCCLLLNPIKMLKQKNNFKILI